MDTLHTVLRTIRGETKGEAASRPNHITVFREFIDQLERINRAGAKRPAKSGKTKTARAAKR